MNRVVEMSTAIGNVLKASAIELFDFCIEHGKNVVALFVGSTVFGAAVVMSYIYVGRAIRHPESVDIIDAIPIGIIISAAVIGIRIMRVSDYTERLFRRW